MSANVSLRDVAWGTKIQVECAYPEGDWADDDVAYSLVVHDDGRGQRAGRQLERRRRQAS